MKNTPRVARILVNHKKNIPLPTNRVYPSWTSYFHMQKLIWSLGHDFVNRWMGRCNHITVMVEVANKIFLQLKLWQSLDKVK